MIGYYVHHHGAGHLARALTIAGPASDRFTLLGTGLDRRTGDIPCVDLADDRPAGASAFTGDDGGLHRPAALHYAPLGHDGVRSRVAAIAGWIAEARPGLMVVDVSAEVAMLARLAATPTVYVRLAGARTDPAHLDAFRGAAALLAPFHPDLDDPAVPAWVRARTRYFPGLAPAPGPAAGPGDEGCVVVIHGAGGGEADGQALAAAARRTPDLTWRVLGPVGPVADPPPNLHLLGWVDDAEAEIALAGVVVGAAGDGVVGAVLAADRPFLCMPQPRPYDEQTSKAQALSDLGAAVRLDAWPDADAWPDLLDRARRPVGDARRRLAAGPGAAEARAWLLSLASDDQAESGTL